MKKLKEAMLELFFLFATLISPAIDFFCHLPKFFQQQHQETQETNWKALITYIGKNVGSLKLSLYLLSKER